MSEGSESSTGSERLLESLWLDARRESDKELARARSMADKLLADIQAYQEEEMAQATERAREAASSQVARTLNRARSTVESKILHCRYSFINQCLEDTRSLITSNPEMAEAVRDSLAPLFRKTVRLFGSDEKLIVTVFPEDHEVASNLASEAGPECSLKKETGVLGGVRMETEDGKRVMDNTVAARLDALAEELPVELMKLTLPEKEAGPSTPRPGSLRQGSGQAGQAADR